MHFHFLRRHRRRLLLPPGLLALVGLLLLGCLAVRPWCPILSQRIIDLNLPGMTACYSPGVGLDGVPPPPPPPPLYLIRMEPFSRFHFSGDNKHDSLQEIRLTYSIQSLVADAGSAGAKIGFGPKAKHKSLVFVLDLMHRKQVRRFFFDTRCDSSNLYAFQGLHGCGTVDDFYPDPCTAGQ